VLVVAAPDERGLAALLARLNQDVFRVGADGAVAIVPLEGRKLHVHPDWTVE
jgi:hypothetical protein